MLKSMYKVVLLNMLCVLVLGCVSVQKNLTPEQRLYSAKTEYLIWANNIVDLLLEHPEIKTEFPESVKIFQEIEHKVYELNKIATLTEETIYITYTELSKYSEQLKKYYLTWVKKAVDKK